MQTECSKLILNETELKKKFLIKECVVLIHPLVLSGSVIAPKREIQPVSEKMNQIASDDSSSEWRAKRKKFASRPMRGRFSRGRMKYGKGRGQRKVTQLIRESQNDGNTSNSENSDGSPLYNEINWEENIACDSTLVDEFAPRLQPNLPQPSCSTEEPGISIPDDLLSDLTDELSLEEGAEIFVRVNLTNDIPEWLAATVVEVDQEEEELLIKYTEGNPPPPMEWMNPTSNRIRHSRPQQSRSTPQPHKLLKPGEVPPQSLPLPRLDMTKSEEIKQLEVDTPGLSPTAQATLPTTQATPPPSPEAHPHSATQTPDPSSAKDDKIGAAEIKVHRQTGPRARGGWKRKRGAMHQRIHHTGASKFIEGEKVLAKWSHHRMQKFPAVIKSILSGGKYDVLFYDGFEKTISEEHIFKTTEEEMAKYQHMNPSEADSFVHMDLDSKEARRQRKKKTFDDYVFAKDFKTKRRVMKNGEHFSMPRKLSLYPKGGGEGSLAGGEEGESDKPIRQKRMRRKRRALFGPKRDNRIKSNIDLQPAPPPAIERSSPAPPTVANDPENFYGFDLDPPVPEIVQKIEPPSDHIVVKTEVPEPVVIKREPTEDRWKPNENQNYKPIEINRDGVTRKSLVVPDNNLPPGWSKHAVVSTTNNLWDVILLSPEGFQINNSEELKEYFDIKTSSGPPPTSLDFLADFNVLAELALKQRDIPAAPSPRIWRRGGRGGRRGGRGHMANTRGRTGVRTLLPKYRFAETSPPVTSPPQPPSGNLPENEFRCPKEGCDKKFRKESLLQMHIKHYHRELSTFAHSAPNMVDLACARSESVNSDWKTSTDLPKLPSSAVKKLLPRTFSSSPSVPEDLLSKKVDQGPETHLSPTQGASRIPDRTLSAESPSMKRQPPEERRTTIKTMLPIRPSEAPLKSGMESDDIESEDDYIEQKKNGSRIFKPGKFRRGSRFFTGMRVDDGLGESTSSSNQFPAFKFTKKRRTDKGISDSYDNYQDEDKFSSSMEMNDDGVVIERLKSEEFINCVCGFREEDGLMIQCDICMCWQHGLCSGIENESDVPDRYVCNICRNPFRVRSSKKYSYAQHYLTQGKLPIFNFKVRNDDEITHREMILKRCFELTGNVLEIKNVDRSLAAKINIAEKADHPKLYMWAKNWEEAESKHNSKLPKDLPERNNTENQCDIGTQQPMGPQPEAPIDLEECRIRLLDHVEHCYSQIEDRLTSLQTQIAALESLDPDLSSSTANDKVTKQTIQMLIRDLETLNKLAAIS